MLRAVLLLLGVLGAVLPPPVVRGQVALVPGGLTVEDANGPADMTTVGLRSDLLSIRLQAAASGAELGMGQGAAAQVGRGRGKKPKRIRSRGKFTMRYNRRAAGGNESAQTLLFCPVAVFLISIALLLQGAVRS